ncbi:hypothetical protein ACET3Z_024589 [Daucus carota]
MGRGTYIAHSWFPDIERHEMTPVIRRRISPEESLERYKAICLKNGIDPKNTHLQIWVKAVGGVEKNRIPGHPRLRAFDIYGPEEGVPPPRKGEARANPEEYSLTPEQIRVFQHNMLEGYTSLPADHPTVKETRHAIIRVAVDVLNNLYKNDQPGADKDKTDQPGAHKVNVN